MTKRHLEPIVWLLFSGGGVIASVFLPILIVLFGLAIPLGWVRPDYDHLRRRQPLAHPAGPAGPARPHAVSGAHRFRFTLYDGLSSGSWPRRSLCSATARRYSALLPRC